MVAARRASLSSDNSYLLKIALLDFIATRGICVSQTSCSQSIQLLIKVDSDQVFCIKQSRSYNTPRNEVRGGILESPCVCLSVHGFPAHNCFPFTPIIMKLHMQTPHESRMCPIDFEVKGQGHNA